MKLVVFHKVFIIALGGRPQSLARRNTSLTCPMLGSYSTCGYLMLEGLILNSHRVAYPKIHPRKPRLSPFNECPGPSSLAQICNFSFI